MKRLTQFLLVFLCLVTLSSPAFAQVGVQGWLGYAANPQHTSLSPVAADDMLRIRWQTPVDLDPQYSGEDLLIHYGAPAVTAKNTVIVTVKTTANATFEVLGRNGVTGALVYTETTDYVPPGVGWTPTCGSTLTPDNRLVTPGLGGTVLIRSNADSPSATVTRVAFFGTSVYNANPSAYNASITIDTPITTDASGNIYFGFLASPNPLNLKSGLARITPSGTGTWIAATTLANDGNASNIPVNSEPAISNDGASIYCSTEGGGNYLIRANSTTLAPMGKVALKDPKSGSVAGLSDYGTAAPVIGPDGDVYYGVQENPGYDNRLRGWLLHFSGDLQTQKPSGAFGWDDSPSIVPASMIPSYTGSSQYLLLCKYNDYLEGGGPGDNKVAIVDPNATMTDPISGVTVMNVVQSQLGPTIDPRGGVKEWCINAAAIDPFTKSAIVNSEDGVAYRWNLSTNTFTQRITLTAGVGEAYTPTTIGPDGTVYCINNGILFAVTDNSVPPTGFSSSPGTAVSGDLNSLYYREGDSLRVLAGAGIGTHQSSSSQVTLTGTSFSANASSLGFKITTLSRSAPLLLTLEMFNFTTSRYETVGAKNAQSGSSTLSFTVSQNASRFINQGNRSMLARISFTPLAGFGTGTPILSLGIDQASWTVNP